MVERRLRSGTAGAAVALLALLGMVLPGCGSSPTTPTPSPSPSLVPFPSPTPTAALPFSGAYRLTIGVDPSCDSKLPVSFQTRAWDVELVTQSDHSDVTFDASTVSPLSPGSTEGSARGANGAFELDLTFLDVQTGAYSLAVTAGAGNLAIASGASPALSGTLFADMRYEDASGSAAECLSAQDSFTLVPR